MSAARFGRKYLMLYRKKKIRHDKEAYKNRNGVSDTGHQRGLLAQGAMRFTSCAATLDGRNVGSRWGR